MSSSDSALGERHSGSHNTEYLFSRTLAQRVLDRPSGDPDDDLAVLARQLLRADEALALVRAALRPFVTHYEPWMDKDRWEDGQQVGVYSRHTFGDLRRARAALATGDA